MNEAVEKLKRIFDYLEDCNHQAMLCSWSPLLNEKLEFEAVAEYYDDGANLIDDILRTLPREKGGKQCSYCQT